MVTGGTLGGIGIPKEELATYQEKRRKYQAYLQAGGQVSYASWEKAGMPTAPQTISPLAAEQWPPGELPAGVTVAPPEPTPAPTPAEQAAQLAAWQETIPGAPPPAPTPTPTSTPTEPGLMPQMPPREEWPEGMEPKWQPPTATSMGGYYYSVVGKPTTFEPKGVKPIDPYGRMATWNERHGEWDYPPDWNVNPQTQEAGYVSPMEQAQIQYWQGQERQQRRELALQKQQQLAQLAAQPRSWLQYAALAGETPAIQPWMKPLMAQQYQAGEALPGWQPEGRGQPMGGLPELTRPSRQYQARIGPTAMGQYLGYQQARTGATPEEAQWRMWSAAPPGGGYRGLRWGR